MTSFSIKPEHRCKTNTPYLFNSTNKSSTNKSSTNRKYNALRVRTDAAYKNYISNKPEQKVNGDETLYSEKIACFTKGFEHNELGIVNLNSFKTLKTALTSKNPDDFEKIKIKGKKLVNPQAGLSFDLEGEDCNSLVIPPPATFSSDEMAGDIVEN